MNTETTDQVIANGTLITANVTRQGAKGPNEAWAIAVYRADHNVQTGYVFVSTGPTIWPTIYNYNNYSNADVHGRPTCTGNHPNASHVAGMRRKSGGWWEAKK